MSHGLKIPTYETKGACYDVELARLEDIESRIKATAALKDCYDVELEPLEDIESWIKATAALKLSNVRYMVGHYQTLNARYVLRVNSIDLIFV